MEHQPGSELIIEFRKSTAPKIDPRKACLLIIDMQEYQIRREWACLEAVNLVTPGSWN